MGQPAVGLASLVCLLFGSIKLDSGSSWAGLIGQANGASGARSHGRGRVRGRVPHKRV